MAVLETVPETVLFRGWHDNDAARGAQRTLLLRNRGPQLQALVTQPLSGLFELRTAAPTDAREPEFFYTFTMPANSTVKLLVEFKPDDKALELYENFQDVLIVHAPGAIIEVPIKACKDCEIGSTLLRSTDLDLEFCPSTEELANWKNTLLQELGPASGLPHPGGVVSGEAGAHEPAVSQTDAADWEAVEGDSASLGNPPCTAAVDLMPPMGLSDTSQQRAQHEHSQPAQELPTLQPAVAIMGRTAVASRQHISLRHPVPVIERAGTSQHSVATATEAEKPTLFLIDGQLCDARGQPQAVTAHNADELRRDYNIIVCGHGTLDDHFVKASMGTAVKSVAATSQWSTATPASSGPSNGRLDPSTKSLVDAVAELGLTLDDLPPNPAAMALSQHDRALKFDAGGIAVSSSPSSPSTPAQSGDSLPYAASLVPQAIDKDSPSSLRRGRSSQISTPASMHYAQTRKLDQATLEANWDAL